MCVRRLVFITFLLTVPVSLFGQAKHDRFAIFESGVRSVVTTGGQVPDEVYQTIKAALSLSDVQVTALKTLVTMREQTLQQIMQSTPDAMKRLQDLANQTNPNPTEVGTAFLAVHSIDKQIQAADEKLRTDFKALLSADQRNTIDKLKTTSGQIDALTAMGVLDGGPHFSFASGPFGFAPGVSFTVGRIGGADR